MLEQELGEALAAGTPGMMALDFGALSGDRSRYTVFATNCRTVAEVAPDGGAEEVRAVAERVDREMRSSVSSSAGLAGFLSYDAKHAFEPAARRTSRSRDPLLRLVGLGEARLLDRALEGEEALPWPAPVSPPMRRVTVEQCGELSAAEYADRVRAIQRDIEAGEYYELNFTQRFRVRSRARPGRVALWLRTKAAAPCWAFLDFGDLAVISASPELFLRRCGDHVETRPIKGSERRGNGAESDRHQIERLVADPKNAAEHTMVVDLARNDLGRICEYGSVRVASHAAVESFPSLHHLVSTVVGKVRGDVGLLDLLKATFPAASITGAPKVRVMQAIEEFEVSPRGIYTGAIGRIGSAGDLDLNVGIRTVVARPLPDGGFEYEFGAGGAVVADSDPDAEYEECLLKARPLLDAILTAETLEHSPGGD